MLENKKEYLFIDPENASEDIFIVESDSINDALYIAAKFKAINDVCFREHVQSKCVNMCFSERFFIQTQEEQDRFSQSGEILVNKKEVKKRINNFFKSKKLANEFINYFYSEDHKTTLSDELLIYVWIKDWQNYQIIDVTEIERKK